MGYGRGCTFRAITGRAGRCLGAALAAGAMISILAPSAGAAPWTQVTTDTRSSLDQVGVARTPDGIVHVLWVDQPTVDSPNTLMHSAFDQAGNPIPGATAPVATNWSGVNESVDLVRTSDGTLIAVWGGLLTLQGSELNGKLIASTGGADGSSWAAPVAVSEASNAYLASGVGAGADPRPAQSTLVGIWGGGNGTRGYSFGATLPSPSFHPEAGGGAIAYAPEIAIESQTGAVVGGWQSLEGASGGIFASLLGPTAPLGPALLAPGSQKGVSPGGRTPITARPGADGVYLAYGFGYPSTVQIRLWRFGQAQATVLLNGKKKRKGGAAKRKKKPNLGKFARGAESISIAAGDGGRLWIFWEREDVVFVTRTNPTATKVKKIARIKPPKGTVAIWRVTGEGSAGPLDLFAHLERNGEHATWQTHVLPSQLKKRPK